MLHFIVRAFVLLRPLSPSQWPYLSIPPFLLLVVMDYTYVVRLYSAYPSQSLFSHPECDAPSKSPTLLSERSESTTGCSRRIKRQHTTGRREENVDNCARWPCGRSWWTVKLQEADVPPYHCTWCT